MKTIHSSQEIQLILDMLKKALLRKLGDEVDLIFQYGSYVRGNAHPYSDVDLSYVPVHEQTWECITVMVGETLVDLYPMHWSKLEHMAEFRDPSSSVLLNNRILYQRTEAVEQRFQALADRLRALLQPEARPETLRKALDIFSSSALRCETTFPDSFDAAYPELKRDLQGVMTACERRDMYALRSSLFSLLREISLGISRVSTGIDYSSFNSPAEYEQDLVALGFPTLLPYMLARDFAGASPPVPGF